MSRRTCQISRISRISRISLIGLICHLTAAAAPRLKNPGWAVEGAPYRVTLHAGNPPTAPAAGWEIQVPDFGAGRADLRDVILLEPDGKEIALDPVWRGTGRSLLLLAETMPADDSPATLYFGGNVSRRMRSWTAQRSLLLETRRLPPGADVATFAGWQEAWKKSPAVDGMGFVPWVFQGDNPFGESHHFLSRYTGMLKTGDGGTIKFYTLSDDVSYVTIDGRAAVQWRKNQPPPLDPARVPTANVRVPAGLVRVEYCHAVAEPPPAMVLGWERGGKLGNVPPEAWVHPGTVKAGAMESADVSPIPLARLDADRYLGYGGEWYVIVNGNIAPPGEGWQVEWLWPDGRVDRGPETHRLWPSLDPLSVTLRLRNGPRGIEGHRTLLIPRDMQASSINNEQQLAAFTGLLEKEDPKTLAEPARRAGFVLARDFLPPAAAARWAEAWLEVAKPTPGPWTAAMTLALREAAKRDPQAALARLGALAAPARAALGAAADLLELDLRVFLLKDPLVIGLVAKLRKSGDKALATMAGIRLGDYQLLNGRTEEAARCYAEAVPVRGEDAGKAPVIDRAHSLALEDLVEGGHRDEARAKLNDWERLRPAAKIDGDQLYWRARVMFLEGEWQRALADLETSLKVRPGSPEEIDVRFWQGRTLYQLDRKPQARVIWNALIKDYPKHERAEAAKAWLEKP